MMWAERVVIITGAASGIGRALAEELARRGAKLVLADCNRTIADVASAIAARGGIADAEILDVGDSTAVAALVSQAVERYGCIDYLFNNAGITLCAELRDTTLADWNKLIDVNLKGVVNGVQAAYPVMIAQGRGHIVNTASMSGLVPTVAEGAYTATKHAVVGLSTTLRAEARGFGVKVSVVCPGFVQTPIFDTNRYVALDKDDVVARLPFKPMNVDEAAQQILRGVEHNDGIIVVPRSMRILWWLYRVLPAGATPVSAYFVDKLRAVRKRGDAPTADPPLRAAREPKQRVVE